MKTSKFKMTEIGEIPADWEVKRFDDTFEHVSSKLFQIQSSECQEGGRFEVVDQGQKEIVGYTDDEKKLFHVPSGGIIIFGDHTRIIKFRESDFVVGADGTQLLAGKEDFTRFLFYVLQQLDIPNLGYSRHFKYLKEGRYVIPSSHLEQKAIAEALRDVDALIAAQEELIEKKRAIKQGAMQELLAGKKRLPGFGGKCRQESLETEDFNAEAQRRRGSECKMTEVGLIPVDWEVKRLGEICDILDNRRIPLNDSQRKSGPYPYCGANGVVAYIDRYIYDEDVILIAEDGGNFEDFATKQIAYQMSGKFWVNNHAHVLVAKEGFSQSYIFFQLEHKDITDVISGGTRAKLTRGQLEGLIIVLPPFLAEQKAIAEVLSDMDAEISELEAQKAKFESIKQGMMQELLTGKIRLEV